MSVTDSTEVVVVDGCFTVERSNTLSPVQCRDGTTSSQGNIRQCWRALQGCMEN